MKAAVIYTTARDIIPRSPSTYQDIRISSANLPQVPSSGDLVTGLCLGEASGIMENIRREAEHGGHSVQNPLSSRLSRVSRIHLDLAGFSCWPHMFTLAFLRRT